MLENEKYCSSELLNIREHGDTERVGNDGGRINLIKAQYIYRPEIPR
jgi:hypothetical protein